MRIKSPFHDYYDCMLAHDKEPEPLFVRKSITDYMEYDDPRLEIVRRTGVQAIVFCGEVHTYATLYVKNGVYSLSYSLFYGLGKPTKHTFYTRESINRFIASHGLKPDDALHKKDKGLFDILNANLFDYPHMSDDEIRRAMYLVGKSSPKDEVTRKILGVFGDKLISACPILHVESRAVTQYPRLAAYEFGKVKTPVEAYRSLYEWFSNQAVPIKPIPSIDDKTMASIKGFDKWSFRKEPVGK